MGLVQERRSEAGSNELVVPARRLQRPRHRFRSRPAPLVGVTISLAIALVALAAGIIAPYDPFATSRDVLQPPSLAHPLGTDDLGRDLLSGVIYGTRVSLLVGLVAALTATALGVAIGATAGYSGGLLDDWLMRLAELFQVLPRFFLALVAAALLGSSIWLIVALLGFTSWPATARLVRAQVLSLRTREYVVAARALGLREPRIVLRHVLPGALAPVVTLAALQVGGAILVEAGLSFLGVGDRSVVSLGGLLNNAQQFVRQAWWMSAFPGLAISLTVLGLSLLADGVNDGWERRGG